MSIIKYYNIYIPAFERKNMETSTIPAGIAIDMAISAIATEAKDGALKRLLIPGTYNKFDDEGHRLLEELDRVAEEQPAFAERVRQVKSDFIVRMDWVKKNWSPEADG